MRPLERLRTVLLVRTWRMRFALAERVALVRAVYALERPHMIIRFGHWLRIQLTILFLALVIVFVVTIVLPFVLISIWPELGR